MNFIQAVAAARRVPVAPSGIVTTNLFAYLNPGDSASYPGSGTTWYDLANSYNFTAVAGAETGYVASPVPAMLTDGINDLWVNGSTDFQFQPNTPFTIQFWYKHNGTLSVAIDVMANRGVLLPYSPGLVIRNRIATNVNCMQFLLGQLGGGNAMSVLSNDFVFFVNSWHLITLSYDGTNANGLRMFKNVTESSTTVQLDTSAPFSYPSSNMEIGGSSYQARYTNGYFGEVLFYDRNLSASEISQNFQATRATYGI